MKVISAGCALIFLLSTGIAGSTTLGTFLGFYALWEITYRTLGKKTCIVLEDNRLFVF